MRTNFFRTASCETYGFETIFSYEALWSPGEAWEASGLPVVAAVAAAAVAAAVAAVLLPQNHRFRTKLS